MKSLLSIDQDLAAINLEECQENHERQVFVRGLQRLYLQVEGALNYNFPSVPAFSSDALCLSLFKPTKGLLYKDIQIIDKKLPNHLRIVYIVNRPRDAFGIPLVRLQNGDGNGLILKARRSPYSQGHLIIASENEERPQKLDAQGLANLLSVARLLGGQYSLAFNSLGCTSGMWHGQAICERFPIFQINPISAWPCKAHRFNDNTISHLITETMRLYVSSNGLCDVILKWEENQSQYIVIAIPRRPGQTNPRSLGEGFTPFGMFEMSGLLLCAKNREAFFKISRPGAYSDALAELSL